MIAFATIAAIRPSLAAAIDSSLIEVVPADAIAVLIVDTTGPPADALSPLEISASIVGHASRMGLLSALPQTESLVLEVFATLPFLARRPFAVVLTDIQARKVGDTGHRLDRMQLGLILATSGQNEPIADVIQGFLNRYTASEMETIQQIRSDGPTIHRLTSRRWPPWVVIEWGPVRDYYLITLGLGAFQRFAKTLNGADREPRVNSRLSKAYQTLGGTDATWMWHVDFRGLVRALSPTMRTIPERVLDALGYADSHDRTWAVIPDNRAVRFECIRHGHRGSEHIRIASPASPGEIADGLIPDQADAYAVITWNPRELVSRTREAYLLARSHTNQRRKRAAWSQIEEKLGISIERDLLYQLGGKLVMHTDPRHPLGIDLLCTVQFPIAGSTRLVRSTIDTLIAEWRREQRLQGNGFVIHHADDGLWYLQFGIHGPALAVLDRWIVISFSPKAVRHNVDRLIGRSITPSLERTDP